MKHISLYIIIATFLLLVGGTACAQKTTNKMETYPSKYSFTETLTRLQRTLETENIAVFAAIDHAEEARKAGLELLLTTVLVVGNPKAGTALMQENQQIAIELPLKILVAANENGAVTVTYKKAESLTDEFNLTKTAENTLKIDKKMHDVISLALGD